MNLARKIAQSLSITAQEELRTASKRADWVTLAWDKYELYSAMTDEFGKPAGHLTTLGKAVLRNLDNRGYEQPPTLTDEDEEILNGIWAKLGEEQRQKNKK